MVGRVKRFALAAVVVVVAAAGIVLYRCRNHAETSASALPLAKVVRTQAATVEPGLVPAPQKSGQRLEGQVIDEDDKPVAGAQVLLSKHPVSLTATSEGDGSFAFDGVEDGHYMLIATKDDLSSNPTSVKLTATNDPVTLRMHAGATVRVHIVAAEDKAPISGALVNDGMGHKGSTGNDGTVTLRGIAREGMELTASAPGRGRVEQFFEVGGGSGLEVTLALPRGSVLSGTVVGPDGKAVADGHVYARSIGAAGASSQRDVATDTAGGWKLEALAAGKYNLTASSELYTEAEPMVVEVDGIHDRTNVTVHAETGAQLVGTVVDDKGKPVSGAAVSIAMESRNWSHTIKTDATGRFAFIGIPPGAYAVSANSDTQSTTRQRVVAPDKQRVDILLKMSESGLAGTVVDSHGVPVADVQIVAQTAERTAWFRTDTSDSKGHFDLGGVPPGSYRVMARRSDQTDSYDNDGVLVQSGNRSVRIVVPGVTTLTGRVVLDNRPVPYFGLVVSDRDEMHWRQSFPMTFKSPDGRFSQKGVASGDRVIAIAGPGFARKLIEVKIEDGKKVDLGDIKVDRGQHVSGHITDVTGGPVTGATVLVEQMAPVQMSAPSPIMRALQGGAIATTDATGAYTIEGIAPIPDNRPQGWDVYNQNRISASHPDRGTVPSRVLAASDTTVDLVLAEVGGIDGTIEGTLTGQEQVWAQLENTRDVAHTSIADRHFNFHKLPAGKYRLTIARQNADGFQVPSITTTVVANRRVPAVFKLPASVTLVVHVASGRCDAVVLVPPGNAPLPSPPQNAPGFAFCEGSDAIILGVVPGSYRACVSADRCAPVTVSAMPARQTLEIPAK
jgi:protocatechuate 3,4-dioxygenase beta subunit